MTAYQFVYYTFYQLFHAISADSFNTWKAGAVVGVLEMWALVSINVGVNILWHTSYLPSNPLIVAVGLGVAACSWYTFDRKNRWKLYAKEFEQYSPAQLRVGRLLVAAVVALIVGACAFTIFQYRVPHSVS